MPEWCEAGRRAKLGGIWQTPCAEPSSEHQHLIAAPDLREPILLCDHHFDVVNALGFVSEPYISEGEYRARGGKVPRE